MSEEQLKKLRLASLYDSKEISNIWSSSQDKPLINHPQQGWISPNDYRSLYKNKPCPYCGRKMVQGKQIYSTSNKQIAQEIGYEYENSEGNLTINKAGDTYFHPNYITLDHKMNKARFPELMFEFNNLEAICWRCNNEKKDNNAFEIEQNLKHFNSLYEEVDKRYKKL
jgi:hypothetical protein